MTAKSSHGTNSNPDTDDALMDALLAYSEQRCMAVEAKSNNPDLEYRRDRTGDITFALLYIADKLDSIDTRLFHLVNREVKKHE